MVKNKTFLFAFLTIFGLFMFVSCAQQKENAQSNSSDRIIVAEYNVENLFDLKDDEGKADEEFTPEGENKWTKERYDKKLVDLAKVLGALDKSQTPDLIGLIEIENRAVVEDLIKTAPLSQKEYVIVHHESPDFRGIDVALVYNSLVFKELSHEAIKISMPDDKEFTTRDILYLKALVKNKDTLHVFVNHWSSRRGGEDDSEPKRVFAAQVLRNKVDSIQKYNANAKVLIMGDMNDEPTNKSILETLKATGNKENVAKGELYNLMFDKKQNGEGTYLFKGSWNMLDNVIISQSMLNSKKHLSCTYTSASIFKEDWILFTNNKGEKSPSRTYGGSNYYGGYSDHLPVSLELFFK